MKKTPLLHLILVLIAVLAFASIAANGGRTFTTSLSGAAEVPVSGDPDGTGIAHITLNRGQGMVCWHISVSGIALPASAAHIHAAPAGSPGGVVVPLSPPDASGTSSGCATGVSRDLIKDIVQNPENYYVNVHNSDYLGGALRGQLSD